MPIPLIALILAAAVTVTATTVAVLYWDEIVNWFRSRSELKSSDRDNIAFTLQRKLDSGDYETVQGIFNKQTSEIVDGRKIQSDDVDAQLKSKHRNRELAIYE